MLKPWTSPAEDEVRSGHGMGGMGRYGVFGPSFGGGSLEENGEQVEIWNDVFWGEV